MSVQKDKTLPGFGNTGFSQMHVGQILPHSHSLVAKKVNNTPRSSYYMFDDDEDDLTTLGRNVSEYIAPTKSAKAPEGKK